MIYKNEFELMGHIGADPVVVELENGLAVNIRLATNKPYSSDNGPQYHTDWHNIAIYGRHASYAAKVLRKGTAVDIEGKIRSKKVTLEGGVMISVTELVVNERSHKIIVLNRPNEMTEQIEVQINANQSTEQGTTKQPEVTTNQPSTNTEQAVVKAELPTASHYAPPPQNKSWIAGSDPF